MEGMRKMSPFRGYKWPTNVRSWVWDYLRNAAEKRQINSGVSTILSPYVVPDETLTHTGQLP